MLECHQKALKGSLRHFQGSGGAQYGYGEIVRCGDVSGSPVTPITFNVNRIDNVIRIDAPAT